MPLGTSKADRRGLLSVEHAQEQPSHPGRQRGDDGVREGDSGEHRLGRQPSAKSPSLAIPSKHDASKTEKKASPLKPATQEKKGKDGECCSQYQNRTNKCVLRQPPIQPHLAWYQQQDASETENTASPFKPVLLATTPTEKTWIDESLTSGTHSNCETKTNAERRKRTSS